jgi:Ca2+/H+ antiporter
MPDEEKAVNPLHLDEKPVDASSEEPVQNDQFLVDWNGIEDPENPQNWTTKQKSISVICLSMLTFVTPLASSMFAPGVPAVLKEFNSNSEILGALVVSVYLIGYAFGEFSLRC